MPASFFLGGELRFGFDLVCSLIDMNGCRIGDKFYI